MPHLYSADRTVLYRYNDGPSDWDEHHLLQIELILSKHCCQPMTLIQEHILDLRQRRAAAPAKRPFDKKEIAKRGENYDKKADNFLDYSDMNMRYLRISGVLQRKGRGLIIVPTKHLLAEKLAKSTASFLIWKRNCLSATFCFLSKRIPRVLIMNPTT